MDNGPDLGKGVPLTELAPGGMIAGHVGEDAVLLARVGDEVYAIGGTCTHYGGPLGEGVLTECIVRCPWHHAQFDVRTGEAVAAPALNPVARWRTEIRNDRVFVTAKEERDPLDTHGRTATGPSSVVIVGAGAAGSAAAEMLRREGYTGPVCMIDPDASAPYDRPNLSKDYLAGQAPEEWIPLRPPEFYAEHGIDRIHASVSAIDARENVVVVSDGRRVNYGALLLATGAAPIRLPIPGSDQAHVMVLRSLDDSRALIRALDAKPKTVIVGASFIGMEAASALRHRGIDVTVVAPEEVPFARVLGTELGELLHKEHTGNGVRFHLGRTLAEIRADRVVLDDGSEVEAELVLLGVGVRPLTQLAEEAGLETDRGVVVDAYLRTSAANIYAAGDICRYPDPQTDELIRIEHWVVAQRQGQTAARNILGHQERFESVPFFWTHQFDVTIAYVGHAARFDATEVDGSVEARDCRVSYLRGNRALAVATIGRDRAALEAELQISASTPVMSLPEGR